MTRPFSKAELIQLCQKDNWHGAFALFADWVTITFAGIVVWVTKMNVIAILVASLIVGSRQRALANLLHEAAHLKLFKSKVLNEALGRVLIAFPLLISFGGYRYYHNRHHSYLWEYDKDPDAQAYRRYRASKPENLPKLVFGMKHFIFYPLMTFQYRTIRQSVDRQHESAVEIGARILLYIAVLTVALTIHAESLLFVIWVLPFLTTYMWISYVDFLGEHASLESRNRFLSTRNWTSSFFVRWLLGPHLDDQFHLTHHLYPRIPCYKLKQADRLLMERDPEYRSGHHCDGFFFDRNNGRSVIHDVNSTIS